MVFGRSKHSWSFLLFAAASAAEAAAPASVAGLPRTARFDIGWGRTPTGELLVQSVEPDSPAARAGLRNGDVIRRIDGRELRARQFTLPYIYGMKGGVPVALDVQRGPSRQTIRFIPAPAPLEAFPGIETTYGVLGTRDGARLRTIVTRPAGRQKLPAILLVQWLSCDTIDGPIADDDGWKKAIEGLVRQSGMIVWRTDKAGVGDSEGDCSTLDWDSELAHHRQALEALAKLPDVDQRRIFIVGMSTGARWAPLVARGNDVAGIVTWGGGATSWFEYIMNHHRYFGLRAGVLPEQLSAKLLREASVLVRLFTGSATGASLGAADFEIWRSMPLVNPVSGLLFNRSMSWHVQAARSEWVEAWLESRAPVLITYGALDKVDTLASVNWAADLINARTPGRAEVAIIQGYNHHYQIFPTIEAAETNQGGKADASPWLAVVLPWLRSRAGERVGLGSGV